MAAALTDEEVAVLQGRELQAIFQLWERKHSLYVHFAKTKLSFFSLFSRSKTTFSIFSFIFFLLQAWFRSRNHCNQVMSTISQQ